MNKLERVKAAFRGEEVDHVPVCMWQHVPQECWDDDAFVKCQLDAYRNTDVDFIKLSGDKYFGWPVEELRTAETAEEVAKLIKPLGENHPYIRGQIERTKRIMKGLNGECAAIYLIFVPLSCIRLKIGYPKMMKFIRENPEAMKQACDVIADDLKLLVQGIIQESGASGIFYSVQNGEENRFTAEEYENWVKPSDKKVLDYANTLSDMNAIHFCAWEAIPNRLSVWKDYKAPVVSWSRYFDIMDINEAKKHFGCTVWGGFDNRPGTLLYTGTRADIENETAKLIWQGGKRGYILGADCSIHNELPEARIRWVVEKAHTL